MIVGSSLSACGVLISACLGVPSLETHRIKHTRGKNELGLQMHFFECACGHSNVDIPAVLVWLSYC